MAHHIQAEDNVAVELTFRGLFKKLWPHLRRYPRRLITSLLLVLAFVLIGRAVPFLFGFVIDVVVRDHRTTLIPWIAAGYFALEVTRALLAFWQSRYIQIYGNLVLFEIREALVDHVQHLPVSFFDKNPSGRTVTRVTNDVYALGELFSQGFAAIFVSLIEMGSIIAAMALISPSMTLGILMILPPLVWICARLSHRIRHQFGAAKRRLAMINAFAAETLGGIKVLQLFARTTESRETFRQLAHEYRELQLSTVRLFATLWPVVEAFNLCSLALALLAGAYVHQRSGLSLGRLGAYILLLQSLFKPLKNILERYNQLQNSLASADRVFHLFDEAVEPITGAALPEGRLRGALELRDVSFGYAEGGPRVLKNLNLSIAPGSSVALVGRTGSGKSSTIALLQKLYPLKTGQILIDGVSIADVSTKSLRSRIGVVQQDGFVFAGTLFSNISLNDASVTRERATWALTQAQGADILARHGGLDGPVLERGANMSAGERQLLAFARVLAFDPDILILDEATANIDSVSERAIQAATERITRDRTSLIIAHRLSTILHCDQIVVLDQGEIVEIGSHDELIDRRGRYFELHRLQFAASNPTPEGPPCEPHSQA